MRWIKGYCHPRLRSSCSQVEDDHDKELDGFADETGVTREEYEVVCALLFLCKVTYSNLLNDKQCKMVCGSSIVYCKMFVTSICGNLGPMQTDMMLDCGELSHPECYCAGYIGNVGVFPLIRLDAQCRTLVLAYSSVCHTPVVSRIAYRYGGIDDKSPEELALLEEAMREVWRMGTDAAEFVHEMVRSGMGRDEAIELLRMTHPKHASKYEGCIKGGIEGGATTGGMTKDAAEFVKGIVECGISIEEAIEVLRDECPKHASLYEGIIKSAKMKREMKRGKK